MTIVAPTHLRCDAYGCREVLLTDEEPFGGIRLYARGQGWRWDDDGESLLDFCPQHPAKGLS